MSNRSFKELNEERARAQMAERMGIRTAGSTPSAVSNATFNKAMYDQMLASEIDKAYGFSQRGPEETRYLANVLTQGTGLTRYKSGDVKNFSFDTARQTQIDNANAISELQALGVFDSADYANSKAYVHLPSDKYLNSYLGEVEKQIAEEQKKDAAHKARNDYRVNTWQLWSDFNNRKDAMQDAEKWAYADYLLNGDLSSNFSLDTYNDRWDEMDDNEFFADQNSMKTQYENLDWATLTNKDASVEDQLYESQTGKYEGYKNVITDEIDRRAQLNALQASIRGDVNYDTLSAYVDTPYENAEPTFGDVNSMVNARVQDAYVKGYDDLNRFINSNAGWSAKMTAADHSMAVRSYLDKGYDYLTQQELADYNALINAGRTEDAARYLELLSPELLYRRAMVLKEYQQVKATNPLLSVPSWIDAGAQQIANVFYLPQQIYETAVGKDNPYSSAYDALNKSQWTSEAQIGAINNADIPDWADKALTFAYKGASGIRDNFARIVAGGGNPTVALILAGAQSASGSLHESSERSDMSGAAKIVKAIGTAAVEVGTEKIGLDALFSKGQKGALQYMKQVILSEVGEETLNAMSEPMLEAVVAYLFDHEAEIMSGPEFWQNLTDTAITTAISSIFMGGGGAISNDISTRSVGRQVQNSGDLEGVLRTAESYSDKPYMAALTRNIRDKQAKNMKITAREVGKLTAEISNTIGEERSQVVDQIADEAIAERLVELGETPQTARKNAPAIRKISRGGKLTITERAGIDWNDNASQVLKEMTTETTAEDAERTGHSWKATANAKAQEAAKAITSKANQLAEAMTTKFSTASAVGKAQDKAKAVTKGKPKIQQREMSFYEEDSGETITGAFERVVKKADEFVVEVKDKAGKITQVALDKISNVGSEGVLSIINYAQDGAHHDMSTEEVNTMVNTYLHEGGDVTSFVQQYEAAYLSGYSGVNAPVSTLSEGVASIAYEHGKAEATKDEARRVVRAQKARKVEKPVVGWLGDVTSDDQIKGAGDVAGLDAAMQKMTDTQQAMVEFGKRLAETAKINIVFFASKAGEDGKFTTQNGSYDPNTHTVYLDINSGASTEKGVKELQKSGTLGDAIGRVAGHELTHVLEATSPEYYAKYKQAVKDALKAKQQDFASLVRGKIDAALANGEKLTYAGAEAEVIADASEYMLQDSKFVKNMDQGLKDKVKTVVQNFLNKVNEAIRRLTGGHIESRLLRTMTDGVAHYEKQLQDLWDMAFDEMLGAETVKNDVVDTLYETGEIYSYTAQKSRRVSDEKTIAYLENQPHITTYRAMQVIDGELYPPMAEFIGPKKDGNREDPGVIGRWEMAVEHPELIKWVGGKPKFELKKKNDDGSVSTVPAAYNPYMHSSNTVLNDQFSKAFQRTNLVVVECVVPVSESDGAYRAQYAKDATGWHEWKSGVVAGDLAKQKSGFRRDVFLSRYIKPVRILPDAEVAEKIAGYLDGTDVTVPFQSAWPTLRDALVQAGINITEPRGLGAAQMKIAMDAFEEWKSEATTQPVQKSIRERDDAYMAAVERGDMDTAQKMVDEAAKAAGYEPVKLYHGTRQFGFTKFNTDKSDDKMSIFVTDDRRIAESYSREGANIPVKNGIKQDRYDFMQQSSAKLEPYVQKWVDKNLKVPTERELRAYTDGESATILSAVDWVDDYLQSNWDSLNTEAKSAISKAMFYAEKLAAIPSADMEDETDGYALRMKFEDAVQDLAWEDRNSYEEIAPVLSRPVYESANNLINARFNDPFYNVNDGTFVSKWDVTDKLGDKLFAGIYELYGDMENLLEIDANDSNWNKIDGKTIGRDGVFVTTREVAEFAKKNGFNGVEIKNVRDGGGMTGYHVASNVLIFFDSTDLKSADPVTYDDSGDVIPLSERFNAANEDIRYSLRNVDHSEATLQENMRLVQKMNPVARLRGNEFKMGKTLKADVKKYYASIGGAVHSPLFGQISLSNSGIKDSLGHGMGPVKAIMYRAVPNVISDGKMIDYRDNWKSRGYDTALIAAPVSIKEGEYKGDYWVGVILNLYADSTQRFYVHEPIVVQKRSAPVVQTGTPEGATPGNEDSSIISILDKLNEVKQEIKETDTDDSSPDGVQKSTRDGVTDTPAFKRWFGDSKVVNNDGTPRVVYHGTGTGGFTVFDKDRVGKGNDQYGAGFYFASNKEDAEHYGNSIYDVYLSIKNPIKINRTNHDGGDLYDVNVTLAQAAKILELHPKIMDSEESPLGDYVEEYWERGPQPWMIREMAKNFRTLGDLEGDWSAFRSYPNEFHEAVRKIIGYDGVEVSFEGNEDRFYVAWFPEQIKSATENIGTFDPNNEDIRYSRREEQPDSVSIREYLGSMKPTERMTETEKLLLKRYKTTLKTLEEKESLVIQQDEIIASGVTGDDLTKAQNRRNIYRAQANRAARELANAESHDGFARIMATSHEIVNRFAFGSADAIADASDALDREITDLSAQLRQLGTDVARMSAGQRSAFARGLFDQKLLNSEAKRLKDTYGSRMSTKAIADRLALAYSEIYSNGGADGAKRFAEAASSLAEEIIRGNKFRYRSEILPTLASSIGSIRLTETDLQEIRNAGLSVKEYRTMLSPYIKITDNGSDLSSYASNAEYYGDGALMAIFGDNTEGNLAMRLYDVVQAEKALEADQGFEGMTESELLMEVMADIVGSTLPMTVDSASASYLRTELLKYAKESETAVASIDAALAKAKNTSARAGAMWHAAVKDADAARKAVEYYRALDEQRRKAELLDQKQMLTEQLKGDAAKALREMSDKYQQQIADIRLRRDINIEIGKRTRHIKRIVKKLNDRIVHEEDYKNVKEPLKPTVHKLVQTFIDGFGNMVFDQKTADRLRSVYDEIANEDGAPEFYSDDVANWLSELADMKEWDALIRAEGSSSLGAAEEKLTAYSRVAEIADHIYKLVTAADEIFIDGKREKFNAFSTETGTALIEHKDSKLLVGKARDAYNAFQNLIVKGNLTPQFFFEHLKNSGMTRLFDGLMRGQTEYAQAIREGQEAVSDAKKRYNFYSWQNMKTGVQFHTEQGHDIALTVPQMMWVYATAKREATNKVMDTHHLDQGGFRYEAKDLPKQKGKMSAVPGSDRLHKLSQADVEKISNALTAEQKACADELVSYLSNECAAQGNRASMELFGIKKYNEEYYFPFKTASDQRYQRSDAGAASTTNDARVKHTSFTHSLRKGANTPLVMGDFFDVIADHINLMATYSSFVVPIESMNRVMNTKINEEADGSGNDVTIRSLIGRKYGEASQKYIADLLKDLNGGPQTDNRGGLSALFRAFKRGAVMGSLSVTLQQPTAIVRAFAYVNPKYFAHITMEGNKKTWERMMKHSGTAVIKEMGKFDVGTGHMANDWIANSDIQEYNVLKRARFLMKTEGWKAVKDNTIEFLTSMPGVMDRITWTHIWKAVEAEQADQHPGMDRNSDEFLDMVGKRFDDVINHTQVYDSVLAKSQNMRSKNPLTQMSTAFMSEPTLNANLYYSAVTGDHTAGQRAGIVTSVIASNLLSAAMESLISAWNKDDDDRKFTEKYLAAFASRAVDNLNPMTMYPYLSDLWSMVSGYDIERTDMSVVQDIWDYGSTFIKKIADGEDITWRDRENFYGTIANLFGIPAKNVSRDIRRIRNLITTDKSASSPSAIKYTLYENAIPLGLWKDTNKAYCQRLVAAVIDGDKQEAHDLWDYLTNTKKPSQNTINTNIRDELKRRVQEGTLTPGQATEILRKYAPYKNDKDNLNKPKEWAE